MTARRITVGNGERDWLIRGESIARRAIEIRRFGEIDSNLWILPAVRLRTKRRWSDSLGELRQKILHELTAKHRVRIKG